MPEINVGSPGWQQKLRKSLKDEIDDIVEEEIGNERGPGCGCAETNRSWSGSSVTVTYNADNCSIHQDDEAGGE